MVRLKGWKNMVIFYNFYNIKIYEYDENGDIYTIVFVVVNCVWRSLIVSTVSWSYMCFHLKVVVYVSFMKNIKNYW